MRTTDKSRKRGYLSHETFESKRRIMYVKWDPGRIVGVESTINHATLGEPRNFPRVNR